MSTTTERGESAVKSLFHYGVKGMKWGVRKGDAAGGFGLTRKGQAKLPSEVSVTQPKPGSRVKATGGKNQPASEDARRAAAQRQKAKASTVDSLSNQELKQLNERLQLEQNFARLTATKKSVGRQFLEKFFGNKQNREKTVEFIQESILAKQVGDTISKTRL